MSILTDIQINTQKQIKLPRREKLTEKGGPRPPLPTAEETSRQPINYFISLAEKSQPAPSRKPESLAFWTGIQTDIQSASHFDKANSLHSLEKNSSFLDEKTDKALAFHSITRKNFSILNQQKRNRQRNPVTLTNWQADRWKQILVSPFLTRKNSRI